MKHESFIIETCEKEIEYLTAALNKWQQRTFSPYNLAYPFGVPEANVKHIVSRISRFEIIIQSLQEL